MIQFKINSEPLLIPTSWEDVTFDQYLKLGKNKDGITGEISIFTGLEVEKLKKSNIEGLNKLIQALSFLKKQPDFNGDATKIGGYPLPLNSEGVFDVQFESLGQFEDLRAVMIAAKSTEDTLVSFASACAIYLQKIRDDEYDSDKANVMVKEVYEMPAVDVIKAGSFFFLKAGELINWHRSNLPIFETTPEETEAGFEEFQKKFGTYGTISQASIDLSIPEEQLYKWPARVFWYKHIWLSWRSFHQSEYQKLLLKRK